MSVHRLPLLIFCVALGVQYVHSSCQSYPVGIMNSDDPIMVYDELTPDKDSKTIPLLKGIGVYIAGLNITVCDPTGDGFTKMLNLKYENNNLIASAPNFDCMQFTDTFIKIEVHVAPMIPKNWPPVLEDVVINEYNIIPVGSNLGSTSC